MRLLSALASGLLFGLGLCISGMVNPTKVLGFLDITGDWDPSLAFVMGTAIPVGAAGFAMARRFGRPVCAAAFHPPTKSRIDAALVAGSLIFGLGWGLAGFCPGPALATAALGGWRAPFFVAAMIVGMLLVRSRIPPNAAAIPSTKDFVEPPPAHT